MRCEITMTSGRKVTYDQVLYIEPRRGNGDEFWLHGHDDGVEYRQKTAGHIGTVLLFYTNQGEVHRYEIKSSTDTRRMMNEVNFLVDLEGVNAL